MAGTDNKIKMQLRPSLPGSGPGVVNRPDKNPSPSKLMINHGKPNYTINRSMATPKTKPITTETTSTTSATSSLTLPLKSTTLSSSLSTSPTQATTPSSQSSNQIEKIILKHVETTTNSILSSSVATIQNSKPSVVPQSVTSFVSPGISSKAAATSFGVKLKQCNNKKNLQNGNVTITNGRNYNNEYVKEEPEFVRRQKQIFEKLQQREQQQQQIESTKVTSNDTIIGNSYNNENNSRQNGHNAFQYFHQMNGRDSESQERNINNSHVKNVTNRLENVSSPVVNNNNVNQQQQKQQPPVPVQQNGGFKLPPGAICGKPVIPGKPANLQIPAARIIHQQQQHQIDSIKNQNGSVNSNANASKNNTINNSEVIQTLNTTTTVIPTPPVVSNISSQQIISSENGEKNISGNSSGANFEQKTVTSFSKELSTEPNRYPDTVKITKPICDFSSSLNTTGGDNVTDMDNDNDDDDDDDGLSEFVANEMSAKLSEEMTQLKFDIKTEEENVTVTPVIIR